MSQKEKMRLAIKALEERYKNEKPIEIKRKSMKSIYENSEAFMQYESDICYETNNPEFPFISLRTLKKWDY